MPFAGHRMWLRARRFTAQQAQAGQQATLKADKSHQLRQRDDAARRPAGMAQRGQLLRCGVDRMQAQQLSKGATGGKARICRAFAGLLLIVCLQ